MTAGTLPYAGRLVTFATMHDKQALAENAFRRILGAVVSAPEGLDTDRFGTFAGDIPRELSPIAAARAKARLGMQIAGTTLGLASEGIFGSGLITQHTELLTFIDDDIALEVVETVTATSPLPGTLGVLRAEQALAFASALDFPRQGIIVRSASPAGTTHHKNVVTLAQLGRLVEDALAAGSTVDVFPDLRAHRAPTRAAVIGELCARMARRLLTSCARCGAPGFGLIGTEAGLECSACGSGTREVATHIHGCGRCEYQVRIERMKARADPRWCDYCNP